ncbi:MAG: TGS domain-containing protein, partial [Pirellulaceae bacterium]
EFCISAAHGTGLEDLRNAMYEALDVVRVYTKSPTKKEPDYDKPYTIRRGGTLLEIAGMVHRDLATNFKYARVWGKHVIAGSQMKGDYVVEDKDIVEIHA